MAENTEGSPRKFVRGPAADLWRHTLVQIPTTFGRLVYLSSLRDQNTGSYVHQGLAQMFGDDEADRTLRGSHQQVFADWLCFDLQQQKNEITEYLEGLEQPLAPVLENWVRFSPYRNFLPAGTRESEKNLYLSDLDLVLHMLSREHGVACPDPEP